MATVARTNEISTPKHAPARGDGRRKAPRGIESTVEQQLAELPHLDRETLQRRWETLFGHPAPTRVRRDLLRRVIAYRIQEEAYGGLKPATVRQLRRMAEDLKSGCTPTASPTASLRPGARLMREWNGDTHVVDVTPDGFTWRGKAYRSLSVIAREITGARWSGPRFFGLKDARK
jgi:hypothetical protein